MTAADIDVYGDDEHPAAYADEPTPILTDDPEWTSRAAWHLRSIRRIEGQGAAIAAAYDREIAKLEQRRAEALEANDRKVQWHRRPLIQFHEAVLRSDPRRKTITLPGGKLTSRTPSGPALTITDRDAFTAWAEVNAPDLIVTTPRVDITKARAGMKEGRFVPAAHVGYDEPAPLVTEHGEVVPGVQAALGATTFAVQPDEDGDW